MGDASGRPDARGHLPALDGLRGVAILLVLVHHATLPSADLTHPIWAEASHLGFAGVNLFFVLSGFLITGILLDARGGPGLFKSFYGRRLLRIAPAYYLFLAVTYLVLPLVTSDPSFAPPAEYRADGGYHAAFASNILFAVTGEARWRPVCHLWSLSIEEQFYLVWPLLVVAFSPRGLARVCGLMIASALALRLALTLAESPHWTVYAPTPARWDALAIGGLIAIWSRKPAGEALLARHRVAIALGAAGLYAAFMLDGGLAKDGEGFQVVGYTSLALLFAGLTVAAIRANPNGRLHRVLTWRWLRAVGAVSYAMYLWQMLARYGFRVFIMDWMEPRAGFWATQAASYAFVFAASFALAWLSWHLVEVRFLRLKRLFPYARDQR